MNGCTSDPEELREYYARIHPLDRDGIPWGAPLVGRGAFSLQVTADDPGDGLDLSWSAGVRYSPVRLGFRTMATARAGRMGPGDYAVELFAPANDLVWRYLMFPRVKGAVLEVPDWQGNNRLLYSVTGLAGVPRYLPDLGIPDFRPGEEKGTMYKGTTSRFDPVQMWKGGAAT